MYVENAKSNKIRASFGVQNAIDISIGNAYCRNQLELITCSGNCTIPMRPSDYICFGCRKNLQYELPMLKAKTTLVMMPLHIAMQWISELRKHLGKHPHDKNIVNKYYCEGQVHNIRYLLYPGISVILRHMNSKLCMLFVTDRYA